MKKHDLNKKILSSAVLLFAIPSMVLGGCGNKYDDGRNDDIALIDPVSVSVSCVPVQKHSFYDEKALFAICSPSVTECSFQADSYFKSYDKMPGETVKKGDVLISGDTEQLDEKIKSQTEKIADMDENYNDNHDGLQNQYSKAKSEYENYLKIMDNLNSQKPDESDPGYEQWLEKNKYSYYDGQTRYAYIEMCNNELQLKETEELYKLDRDHENKVLQRLYNQKRSKQLTSEADGVVIALNYFENGPYISKNALGMAVGDLSAKEIRTSYISQGVYNKAKDVYALADGKRYEVEFHPMNNQEYELLNKKNGVVYSTFSIEDPNNEISIGDYLVIVLVNDVTKDVLSVPKSAVGKDASGEFVYVFENDSYTERYIRTGHSDGAFIEVLSGLEEGETVKCDYKMKGGATEHVLKKGTVSNSFSENGYLFYPSQKNVENPVQYGVTYFDELCVGRYETVEKGQTIAKVHVVSDSIEIERTARQLQRLDERIASAEADYKKSKDSGADEYTLKDLQKNIDRLKEQRNELNKTLSDMKSDANLKEIKAPVSGIVTDITWYNAGDIINAGATVVKISDESSCFIVVQDKDGKLSYGNTANVSYKDTTGAQKTTTGTVVTANPMVLSEELKMGYALIKLDPEVVAEMALTNQNSYGMWNVQRFGITATIRDMDDVVLVPRAAVTEISGTSYVTVKDENGSLRMVSFVAGGSDSSYYWVLEGLEEGQTVCWE